MNKEERAEICRNNGRKSNGPIHTSKGKTLKDSNPEEFKRRFWSRTKTQPDGCLKWTGAIFAKKGYGRVNSGGRCLYAHRLSWEIIHGPIPSGMRVLHSCDNPICVSPSHLRIGTHKDNMHDREIRGRSNHEKVESRYNAKLNPQIHSAVKTKLPHFSNRLPESRYKVPVDRFPPYNPVEKHVE